MLGLEIKGNNFSFEVLFRTYILLNFYFSAKISPFRHNFPHKITLYLCLDVLLVLEIFVRWPKDLRRQPLPRQRHHLKEKEHPAAAILRGGESPWSRSGTTRLSSGSRYQSFKRLVSVSTIWAEYKRLLCLYQPYNWNINGWCFYVNHMSRI